MITPLIEKLLFKGEAAFHTAVIGGTEKHVLNVPKDHFVILTDLTFFSSVNGRFGCFMNLNDIDLLRRFINTQLRVTSTKSQNTFLFRNGLTACQIGVPLDNQFFVAPVGSVHLDVFLVHDSDISFSFSLSDRLIEVDRNLTDPRTIGMVPPTEYGKQGQIGALPVKRIVRPEFSAAGNDQMIFGGENLNTAAGQANTLELAFPQDNLHVPLGLEEAPSYPILNVSYVLVNGTTKKLSASL